MVHYVRFLRTPQVSESNKKTLGISAVLAVTTDLGDSFCSTDVELVVRVVDAHHPHEVLQRELVAWQGSSRALKFAIQCNGKYSSRPVQLHISTEENFSAERRGAIPTLIDVWSVTFQLIDKQRAEPVVKRNLLLANNTRVKISEETGDSIARHIWDASLGFLVYFRQALASTNTQELANFRSLINAKRSRPLRVLELGAGCGIVGIALAQLVKCDTLLTDLEDASQILETNIAQAKPITGSTLQAAVLDWSLGTCDSLNTKLDLVLVSDCIYNPDSSVHLVETLQRIARRAPDVLILVGFKRRHEADTIFFEYMERARFRVLNTHNIQLPHTITEQDVSPPVIEFYTYQIPADA